MDSVYIVSQLERMKDQLALFEMRKIKLASLINNLWGLFEAIGNENQGEEFSSKFHRLWDEMEIINSLGAVDEKSNYDLKQLNDGLNRLVESEIEKRSR